MPTSLRDLVNGLLGTRDGVHPSIQAFPSLDTEQIARELRLESRAVQAASAGQPAPDAVAPDSVEHEILSHIDRRARKAREEYQAQLDLYDGRIRRATLLANQWFQIEASVQATIGDFKARIVTDQNHLHVLQTELEGRDEEFRHFRQTHGLRRLPRITSRGQRWLHLLVGGVFFLVESIMNGMFFAQGSQQGLIGGIVQAAVLSILNVGTASLYAWYALPQLAHQQSLRKAVGVVLFIAFVLWAASLNLSIGHYRDLYILSVGNVPMAELWSKLSSAPLLLQDAKSGILVLMGIGLAVLSVLNIRTIHDPYPGYSDVGSERKTAIERYAAESDHCLEGIRALRDAAVDTMETAIDQVRNSDYDAQLALEGRSRLHHLFSAFLDHLAVSYSTLIQQYRERNLGSRGDVQVPPYFRIQPIRPPLLDHPTLAPLPDIATGGYDGMVAFLRDHISVLNNEFEMSLPQYRTVDQLTTHGPESSVTA